MKKYSFGGKFPKKNIPYIGVKHKVIDLLKVGDIFWFIFSILWKLRLCLADTKDKNDWIWYNSQHEEESMTLKLLALTHLKFYRDDCLYTRTDRLKLSTRLNSVWSHWESNNQQLIDGSVVDYYWVALHLIREQHSHLRMQWNLLH